MSDITEAEVEEWRELAKRDISDARNGGCTDYYCDCHLALPRLLEERDRLRGALIQIASYHQGPVVTPEFDEPCAASVAREALEGGANDG